MDSTSATLAAAEAIASEASMAVQGTFEQLLDEIQHVVHSADSQEALLQQVADKLRARIGLESLVYYSSDTECRPADRLQRFSADPSAEELISPQIAGLVQQASRDRSMLHRSTMDGFLAPTVAVPVSRQSGEFDALCAILGASIERSMERVEGILQVIAAQLSVWQLKRYVELVEREAHFSTALVELVTQLDKNEDVSAGCLAVVNQVQEFLGCQRVAIGLCRGQSRHCQLKAISGFAKFDRHAEVATALEAALDETLILDETVRWPQAETEQRQPARTLEQLLAVMGAEKVISAPLKDGRGNAVGAWLFLNPKGNASGTAIDDFIAAAQTPIGTCLGHVKRSRDGFFSRLSRRWLARFGRQRWILASVAAVLVLSLLMWPRPHRIGCDCTLQPELRRFVAAPFDGTLERSLVKPGDVVAEAEVLAVMDGREIRLELSAMEAEHARARKAWEIALAADSIHEAQQAKLDMRRLELKIQLLRDRQQHLQIKSPFHGVVVSGDLEESQGAPLTVGQTLFEIGPLENMKVEVIIPEADIADVRVGMETLIRLDAQPRERISSRITRIVPRAEVRDNQFVFVAEADVNTTSESLRPGMNGRATLVGPRRTVAWLLFHKPYDSLLMWLGW